MSPAKEDFMKALFLTLAASSLLAAPAAFSQTQPSTTPHSHPNVPARRAETMVDRHVDRLVVIFSLTPEQKKQATTYFSDAWNANRSVMMQMREDRKALDKDIEAKADQTKLTADATAIGHDQSSIMANNAYAQEKFSRS